MAEQSNPFMDSLLGGLGTGIAGKALGMFNKKEKPIRGFGAGKLQKDYYKGLYGDKLNPWEWQGHSGEGGVSAPIATGQQARNTLGQKQSMDVAMQQAQLKNNIDVAKIGAGLTPGKDVDPDSKQGNQIKQIISETNRTKDITAVLGTAKALAAEFQEVLSTLKGEQKTLIKQLQEQYKKAMGNAQGNLNLMKNTISRFGNKALKALEQGSKYWKGTADANITFKKSPRSTSSPLQNKLRTR